MVINCKPGGGRFINRQLPFPFHVTRLKSKSNVERVEKSGQERDRYIYIERRGLTGKRTQHTHIGMLSARKKNYTNYK